MRRLMTEEEVLALIKKINSEFGSDFVPAGFKFFSKDEKRGSKKIFLYSGKEIPKIPTEWIGLHFGTLQDDEFVPSIEGSQMIGSTATKRIFDIKKEEAVNIMSGHDMDLTEDMPGEYYILKSEGYTICVGKIEGKKVINNIPKSRRISRQYRVFDE